MQDLLKKIIIQQAQSWVVLFPLNLKSKLSLEIKLTVRNNEEEREKERARFIRIMVFFPWFRIRVFACILLVLGFLIYSSQLILNLISTSISNISITSKLLGISLTCTCNEFFIFFIAFCYISVCWKSFHYLLSASISQALSSASYCQIVWLVAVSF